MVTENIQIGFYSNVERIALKFWFNFKYIFRKNVALLLYFPPLPPMGIIYLSL